LLSDAEIKTIWNASGDGAFGDIIRLCILTGCRKGEIAGLSRSEIDLVNQQITLPPWRTKNKREHVVPMSVPVQEIIQQRLAVVRADPSADANYLFKQRGAKRPFSNWPEAVQRLNGRINVPDWHAWLYCKFHGRQLVSR
jgi:integrase